MDEPDEPADAPEPPFSKPFNWCDRQCERCRIAERCPLVLREKQLRWLDEARGIDPDAPGREWEHLSTELERAVKLIEQAALEDGVDLSAPMPAQVIPLHAERLNRAALRIGTSLRIKDHEDEAAIDALHPSFMLTMKLAGKLARVGGYMVDGSEVWTLDGEPNLLLIEHVARALRAELERVRVAPEPPLRPPGPVLVRAAEAQAQAVKRAAGGVQEQAADALAALDALEPLLNPLLEKVSAAARAELAAMIAAGEAPSPFLVVDAPAANA